MKIIISNDLHRSAGERQTTGHCGRDLGESLQGTPEARQASLMAVMEAVWTSHFQGMINKILNGQAKLAYFRKAVESWEVRVKKDVNPTGFE